MPVICCSEHWCIFCASLQIWTVARMRYFEDSAVQCLPSALCAGKRDASARLKRLRRRRDGGGDDSSKVLKVCRLWCYLWLQFLIAFTLPCLCVTCPWFSTVLSFVACAVFAGYARCSQGQSQRHDTSERWFWRTHQVWIVVWWTNWILSVSF